MTQSLAPSLGLLLYGCQGPCQLPSLLPAKALDSLAKLSLRSLFQALGLLVGLGQKRLGLPAGLFEPTVQFALMLPEPPQGLRLSVL